MTKQRRIHVIGRSDDYANWCEPTDIVDRIEDADLVMLSGGHDVDPTIYSQPRHCTTSSNITRDRYEIAEFNKARALGLPVAAVCRGSQLACCLAGGILIQDMDHPSRHDMETIDGKILPVNSSHHQNQYPWRMPASDYKILGWTRGISSYHLGGNEEELVNGIVPDNKEVELAYYPKIMTIAVQFHPEWFVDDPKYAPTIAYLRSLLDRLMNGTL